MKHSYTESEKIDLPPYFLLPLIKKVIILFVILSLIFISILSAFSLKNYFVEKNSSSKIQSELADKVLRFHVIANSNSTEDQNIKMQVKSMVLDVLKPYLTNITSKEQAITIINSHISEVVTTASNILEQNGKPDTVIASITKSYFPIKSYGDITFPSGIYDTLNIKIGQAQGRNWWCVMYPPLCFADDTFGYLPSDSKQILQNTLSPKAYAYIQTTQENQDNSSDEPIVEPTEFSLSATANADCSSSNAQISSKVSNSPDTELQISNTSPDSLYNSQAEDVISDNPKIKIKFKIFTFLNNIIDK